MKRTCFRSQWCASPFDVDCKDRRFIDGLGHRWCWVCMVAFRTELITDDPDRIAIEMGKL